MIRSSFHTLQQLSFHSSLFFLHVSSSILTPSLLVPALPSHCLSGLSVACTQNYGPCPSFLALETSGCGTVLDPCHFLLPIHVEAAVRHRLTCCSRSACKTSFFSLSVVQDIPATLFTAVVTVFFCARNALL